MKLRDLKRRNRRRRSVHFMAYWVGADNRRGETKLMRVTFRGRAPNIGLRFTFDTQPPAGATVQVMANYSPRYQPLGAPHALDTR